MKRKFNLFVGMLLLVCIAPRSSFAFYNPETGRWLSRDAIEEEGGVNLYSMAANAPVDAYDPSGLFSIHDHGT